MTESPTQHPPSTIDFVAQGFTSTGGYVLRATEATEHAGRIPILFVADDPGDDERRDPLECESLDRFVRLEVEEAAEVGLWLLRNVVEHLPDPTVRAAVRVSLDRASRMIGETLT